MEIHFGCDKLLARRASNDGCRSAVGFEPNKMLGYGSFVPCKKCLLNGTFQVAFILLSRKVELELGNIVTIFAMCT